MKKQPNIASAILIAYDLVRRILKRVDPSHKYAVEKQKVLRDAIVLCILIKSKTPSSAYKCYEKSWEHQIAKDLCCSIKTARRIYENALKTKYIVCRDGMLIATSLIEGYIKTIKPDHKKIEKTYQVFAFRIKKVKCGDKSSISYKHIIEILREEFFRLSLRKAKCDAMEKSRRNYDNNLPVSNRCSEKIQKYEMYIHDVLSVGEDGIVSFSFDRIGALLGLSASGARNFVCKIEKKGYIQRQAPGLRFKGVLSEFFEMGLTLQQVKERYTVLEDRVYENPACRYLIIETRKSAFSSGSILLNHIKRRIPQPSKKERQAEAERIIREAKAWEEEVHKRACSPSTKTSWFVSNGLMDNNTDYL